MRSHDAYEELIRRTRDTALLESTQSLLSWDQETYMPPGGGAHRGDQLAFIAGMIHERRTDPRLKELLSSAEEAVAGADPSEPDAVNVRQLRRSLDRAAKLPRALVEELARVTSTAHHAWAEARKAADFSRFAKPLARIVELKKEEAQAVGAKGVLYDALIDEYEEGATCSVLQPLFDELRKELISLLHQIEGAPRRPDSTVLHREFAVDAQERFGRTVATAFGFDFQRGRLDQTAHPCCITVGPGDCRLATRYNPTYFNDAFFSTLHEAGHGLYEQGLDPEHFGTPMGSASSLGAHESQSRLWENGVARSLPFWRRYFPDAQAAFPNALGDVSLETFHFAVNAVSPGFIRVDADEATYNLHILLRFELEQKLLNGALAVVDVPTAWNEAMGQYLGVVPENDRLGCLQDVHWSAGLIGYFPTYTLGNINAAQLLAAADRDLGGLDDAFARGQFKPLLDWLRGKVHRHGMRFKPADLIEQATGAPPDAAYLVRSLRKKYSELYGF